MRTLKINTFGKL